MRGIELSDNPVAVGAIGGSGSRVIASILETAGIAMGANLNGSHDNLEFTARFKNTAILDCPDDAFYAHYDDFARLSRAQMQAAGRKRWGWKEPNTHMVIDRLMKLQPGLRYVHLLRNGLDMAWSENQNQMRLWGPAVLPGAVNARPEPARSLGWFCYVHRRITALADSPALAGRVLVLDFDRLCAAPLTEVTRLMDFLDHRSEVPLDRLAAMVKPPASVGRARAHGLAVFDPVDLDYLRQNQPHMLHEFAHS